ncbi:hypothetical protein C801_00972 [Bacteroides uniformis dnLKV2]|uniref:Uncharacterized protein n=1 Tax=Bacteroides uniformis dnLKV2 TaxID=1235787 RepID=R9I1B6_BACUN|nr:hypothetical protein C801_00972 [Bacteroides uniformis dnLKV2]
MFILNIQLYFMAWQIILKPFIIYFTFHTSIYIIKRIILQLYYNIIMLCSRYTSNNSSLQTYVI